MHKRKCTFEFLAFSLHLNLSLHFDHAFSISFTFCLWKSTQIKHKYFALLLCNPIFCLCSFIPFLFVLFLSTIKLKHIKCKLQTLLLDICLTLLHNCFTSKCRNIAIRMNSANEKRRKSKKKKICCMTTTWNCCVWICDDPTINPNLFHYSTIVYSILIWLLLLHSVFFRRIFHRMDR